MSMVKDILAQLMALGVYDAAFDGEIHTLCVMERELSRAMKEWKATAPDPKTAPSITDPLYAEISKLRRDILARQDSLGLTPKGLQRLRRQAAPSGDVAAPASSANPMLSQLLDGIRGNHNGGTP